MRTLPFVLSWFAAGALANAVAQTPEHVPVAPAAATPATATAPAAAPAAPPVTASAPAAVTAPAAPVAPAAAPAAASATSSAEPTAFERQLIAKGYKPTMYGSQKMYCRTEEVIGSRLGGHKVCGTADQLALDMHDAQELTEQAQKMPVNGGH